MFNQGWVTGRESVSAILTLALLVVIGGWNANLRSQTLQVGSPDLSGVSEMDLPVSAFNDPDTTGAIGSPAGQGTEPTRFRPGIRDVPAEERTLRFRGFDLSAAPWFVSADLAPSTPPEQLAVDASPTSAIVLLRAPRDFDKATLFTVLFLEALPGLPAVLTLGGVEGTDEVFLNGTSIGTTSHTLTGDPRLTRRYPIPASLLKQGANVLAIRLQGANGQRTFGLSATPLTFQFLPVPAVTAFQPRIFTQEADSELSSSVVRDLLDRVRATGQAGGGPLYQRPPGWGRFAGSTHDGLPTVEYVSPLKMRHRTAPMLDILHDSVTSISLATTGSALTTFQKHFSVESLWKQQPYRYGVQWSVLYPGMRLLLQGGQSLSLRITFSGNAGEIVPLDPLLGSISSVPMADNFHVLMAYQIRSRACPLILAVRDGEVNLTRSNDVVDVTIRPVGARMPTLHAFYPAGVGTWDLRNGRDLTPAQLLELMATMRDTTSTGLLREWIRIGFQFPVESSEWFQVAEQRVRCFPVNVYESIHPQLTNDKLDPPYLPLPPLVGRVTDLGIYPKATTARTGTVSWSGPLHYSPDQVTASTSSGRTLVASKYELRLPASQFRLLPSVDEASGPTIKILRELLGNGETSDSLTALDMIGGRQSALSMVWAVLQSGAEPGPSDLRLLESQIATSLRSGPPWSVLIDWLSGAEFSVSGLELGPGEEPAQLELPLSRYIATLSAHWRRHRDSTVFDGQLPRIRQLASYLTGADDWEWMKPAASYRGLTSGGSDSSYAYVSAMHGMRELATAKGDDQAGAEATYYYARAMCSLYARLGVTSWPGFGTVETPTTETVLLSMVEGGAALTAEPSAQPLLAMESAAGSYEWPDVVETLLLAQPDLMRSRQRRLSKSWSGAISALGERQPLGGQVLAGMISELALRGRLRLDSFTELDRVVRLIIEKGGDTVAPQALAAALSEIALRDLPAVYIQNWSGLDLVRFRIRPPEGSRQRRILELTVRVGGPGPGQVSIHVGSPVYSQNLNDGPLPLTDYLQDGSDHSITVRRKGESAIQLRF